MAVADRKIICTNDDGVSVEFREDMESPYILMSTKGVYTADYNVSTSDNTMIDGATYQGSVAKKRNIVLYIKDLMNFYDHRNHLNAVFKQGKPGKFVIEDEGIKRSIDYYVESINGNEIKPHIHYHTISLMCPNPFFTTVNPNNVYIANWVPCFEWEHEFKEWKEPFGYRSRIKTRTIENVDAMDNVGMSIMITCTGGVVNPVLTLIERNEHIRIGTQANPFTMTPGDVLEITTADGNKHVYYTHESVRQEQNYLMAPGSAFIQLERGNNTFAYDADEGADYMIIKIKYNMTYARA